MTKDIRTIIMSPKNGKSFTFKREGIKLRVYRNNNIIGVFSKTFEIVGHIEDIDSICFDIDKYIKIITEK